MLFFASIMFIAISLSPLLSLAIIVVKRMEEMSPQKLLFFVTKLVLFIFP